MSNNERRRAAHQAPRRRIALLSLGTALLVFLGACIMLYPSAASWFSAMGQGQESGRYVETVEALHPQERAAALQAAVNYNASLADGSRIVDPFAAIQDETVKTDDPYWDLLEPSGDGIMARLRIPKLDLTLPVYHGTGADILRQGAGHLQGTALPVGGTGTHAVMTGHRGLPQATLFTHLDKLQVGDTIEVDVYGRTTIYQVQNSSVVLPSETETLRPEVGRDLLTLVTCTPLGINSHRILVTAERVDATLPTANTPATVVGFPWWALVLLGVLSAGTVYVLRTRRVPAN
ncbi:hypothetical protein ART_1298 [Arthrobacter sp. PAMC 25486]|uniref:class C sortase n=1 Tax=Arthrobacter sp. PAMC 25486 TaxID=1494608 RepID=UPI000535D7D0|nr:class C sortase [Arthrobacter sp. PAMC 25486]AIY00897.1 hypothetical protein ART_1298 [Arthrobacter sp. PAMC 25486]